MKKILLFSLLAVFFISCEKESLIAENELPSEITTYLNTHFPSTPVIQIIKDKDGFEVTYEINLDGGFYLEFNKKRQIIDIEGTQKLPDSVIPSKIREYTSANYPSEDIIGWEKDGYNQQIKFNNGLELLFSQSGEFLRIDN